MLVRSLIPRLWETLNMLLGVGLINFSNKFLKISYDTHYEFSSLNYSIPWLCAESTSLQNLLFCKTFVEIYYCF